MILAALSQILRKSMFANKLGIDMLAEERIVSGLTFRNLVLDAWFRMKGLKKSYVFCNKEGSDNVLLNVTNFTKKHTNNKGRMII
jgi:hypothetical protein